MSIRRTTYGPPPVAGFWRDDIGWVPWPPDLLLLPEPPPRLAPVVATLALMAELPLIRASSLTGKTRRNR